MANGISLPQLHADTGALPPGRYSTTADVIEASFGTSTARRAKLWGDWNVATELLRSHAPICAAWIGGSYVTDKPDPDDIDCVYIVESSVAEAATGLSAVVLGAFAQGKAVRQSLGLELDTFMLHWTPSATPKRSNPAVRDYHSDRGYWDDLWSKMRSGSKAATPVKLDAHPRRGYVEVILDGYPEDGPFCVD